MFLTPAAVASFVADAIARNPLESMSAEYAEYAQQAISLVLPLVRHVGNPPTLYNIGTLHPRLLGMAQRLITSADGTAPAHGLDLGLTAEAAVFPYLFPGGAGFFTGDQAMKFVRYLYYRSRTFFTVYTLCKPYMMIMYVMRQCQQLSKPAMKVSGGQGAAMEC